MAPGRWPMFKGQSDKLWNSDIEDTSLLDDITAVRNAAKKVIDDRRIVPENRIKEAIRPEQIITTKESEDDTIDDPMVNCLPKFIVLPDRVRMMGRMLL